MLHLVCQVCLSLCLRQPSVALRLQQQWQPVVHVVPGTYLPCLHRHPEWLPTPARWWTHTAHKSLLLSQHAQQQVYLAMLFVQTLWIDVMMVGVGILALHTTHQSLSVQGVEQCRGYYM